jgi:hypothetical protein
MTALVIVEAVAILLLGLLVAGLLRSHAEILRKLHDLGVHLDGEADHTGPGFRATPDVASPGVTTARAHDLAGTTPDGDAIGLRVVGAPAPTLVAFLSSGCTTCAGFWEALSIQESTAALGSARLVVVTKDRDEESPSAIAAVAPADVPVVMSSRAWGDYGVPGSPYFVLADGRTGLVRGEGSAGSWDQLVRLMDEALTDTDPHRSPKATADLEREARADRELMAAGIYPGHPSLYADPSADEDEDQ